MGFLGLDQLGGSHSPGYQLQKAGYREFDPLHERGAVAPATGPGIGAGNGVQINQGPQGQFRQGEMDLMNQLQMQARGQGPSLAQGQLAAATGANMQETAGAMQAAGGGLAPGAQRYMLAQQQGAIGQQGAQQAAQLRLQEQLQAQQQLAGVMGQARSGDIGLAEQQANLGQQAAGLGEQQYEFGQGAANTAAQNFNNAIVGLQTGQNQAEAQQQAILGNVVGKALNAPGAVLSAGAAATGKVLTAPETVTAGEAGPEVIVPVAGKHVDMTRATDPDLQKYLKEGGLETPFNKDAEEGGADGPHMERHALMEALMHLKAAHQRLSSLGVEI